jgi:salicylate synthetase
LQIRLAPKTPLARVFWPRTRIVVSRETVRLVGADDDDCQAVRELLDDGLRNVPRAARLT